jgi:hypothetical protein
MIDGMIDLLRRLHCDACRRRRFYQVDEAKARLRWDMSLLCRASIPVRRVSEALHDALGLFVDLAQAILRLGMPAFGHPPDGRKGTIRPTAGAIRLDTGLQIRGRSACQHGDRPG